MRNIFDISVLIIFYIAHLCAGYRRYYNTPVKEDWEPPEPTAPTAPPVEEVPYSVVSAPLAQGGALHWDVTENVLYFTDVAGQTLYRYDPVNAVQKSIKFVAPVSLVIPIKGQKHHMVVGLGNEMVILRWYWDSGNFTTSHLASADPKRPSSRWGIGKADGLGRIWAVPIKIYISTDTMGHTVGASTNLYVIDTVKSCRLDAKLSDQGVSNSGASPGGLAWSPDNKTLYYSSLSRKIIAIDFNIDSGMISNPRTVFDYGELPGSPAGLTVDQEGNLWIASFGGSQIIQINPSNGKLLRQLKLPVKQVTSVVFGGPQLEDLYLASAGTEEGGLGGSVLKVSDLKEAGVSMYSADILCKPCNDKMDADSGSWWCTAAND